MPNDKRYYRNGEDLHFKLTTSEEERALFKKARRGCQKSRDFLIQNHLLYAAMLARRIAKYSLDEDELISAANNAVMATIDRFDYTRGNRYSTYLKHFVRGEVLELLSERRKSSFNPAEQTVLPEGIVDHEAEARDLSFFRKKEVAVAVKKLSPKEQKLIQEIYVRGKTFAQVARDRGVTRQAVCNLHAKLLRKMRGLVHKECR